MKLDSSSVNRIIGKSKKAMVFGFAGCKYAEMPSALKNLSIEAYVYSGRKAKNNIIPYDNDNPIFGNIGRKCKAIITGLIIQNYKREALNKPIVPLIFCIEYEDKAPLEKLNIEKLADSKNGFGSRTNAELLRCYKIYLDFDKDLKGIAEKTFKFVKVRKDSTDSDLYYLDPLPPFWEDSRWAKLWDNRMANKKISKSKKQLPWRKILNEEISKINLNFFCKGENNKDLPPTPPAITKTCVIS